MWPASRRRSFGVMQTTHDTNQSGPPRLETFGLTKRFGDRVVVDDVTIAVPPASAFGLLGQTGYPPPAPPGQQCCGPTAQRSRVKLRLSTSIFTSREIPNRRAERVHL